jgi:hypothetical protein
MNMLLVLVFWYGNVYTKDNTTIMRRHPESGVSKICSTCIRPTGHVEWLDMEKRLQMLVNIA